MTTSQRAQAALSLASPLWKRLFDLSFSLFALALGSPFFLLLILSIKCTSKGPVFYKNLRVGLSGQTFYCWKFRTMCLDAKQRLEALLAKDPKAREEWKTYHKLKSDPRLTPIGKFLRMTSLDELPQFWNVLIGDLSVVGPRPIEVSTVETADQEIHNYYGNRTDKILSVKPGITCIWQTRGRNFLTIDERAALEEEYVDSHSLWLDMKLIGLTILVLINPKGAF